jgi:hypothetical protein
MLVFALFAQVALAAPDPSLVYEYRGPGGEGSYPAADIIAMVRQNPMGDHQVRGPGARDWTPWREVPELAEVWLTSTPPGRTPAEQPATSPPRESPRPDAPAHGTKGASAGPEVGVRRDPPPDSGRPPVARPQALAVRFGGDVRAGLHAEGLEGGATAPSLGFVVSRVRPVFDVSMGEHLHSRVSVELRQDDGTTLYEDTGLAVDVRDWAQGWSLQAREVWLGARFGQTVRHDIRIGLLEPAFGQGDAYEERYPFAGEQRLDLARRAGLVPETDVGLGWRAGGGEVWSAELQVLNGSGGTSLDQNLGKDFVARLGVKPIKILGISAAGTFGARGVDATGSQAQGSLGVELNGPRQRLLVEGLIGATTEDRLDTFYSGAAASGAWEFPVKEGVLDRVIVVGRGQYYDPVAGWDAPDGWWSYAAGAWAGWRAGQGQRVRTGVTWETYVPQDLDSPVTHEIIVEAAWRY